MLKELLDYLFPVVIPGLLIIAYTILKKDAKDSKGGKDRFTKKDD